MQVIESVEPARGCGYRKPGKGGVGIYLVGPPNIAACGKMPWPLDVCPCCNAGIKPTRGWTWITPSQMFAGAEGGCGEPHCSKCPVSHPPEGKHGLLWIGEQHYSVASFLKEASSMGISRKLSAIPNDLEIGKTWVYLAHRSAIHPTLEQQLDGKGAERGVFSAFLPTGIDLVIEDLKNVPSRAKQLAKFPGARVVRVVRTGESSQEELFDGLE